MAEASGVFRNVATGGVCDDAEGTLRLKKRTRQIRSPGYPAETTQEDR